MTRRVALSVLGVLGLLAGVLLQLLRFTDDPLPVGASPALVLLSLGCLSGGAWALVVARSADRGQVTEDG